MQALFHEYYNPFFESKLLEEIEKHGHYYEVNAGEKIIDIGQTVRIMPLLIDGAIKVIRDDSEGEELLLYFLEQGDTCAMSLSCCMGNKASNIRAVAETDIKFVGIPVGKIRLFLTWFWNEVFVSFVKLLGTNFQSP